MSYNPGVSQIEPVETAPAQNVQILEEVKSKFLDLSEFLKHISQKHIVDSFSPDTFCGIDDDINAAAASALAKSQKLKKSTTSSSSSSNAPKGTAEKVVDIEVGDMGKFTINIFTDGFVINSATYGNTIEIAGIGQPTLFVKEYNSTSSTVVIGSSSMVSTCNIRLDIDWPFEIWKKKAYNLRDFGPEELLKNR